MKKILIIFLGVLFTTNIFAQDFDLTGEVRARYENRNGYKALHQDSISGANFISQRTRINFDFKKSKMTFKVSLQNVRTWGDVSTLSSHDNGTSIHEAWAEAKLNKMVSLKMGRQEIIYDDHRIFGSVGWAQQARSHDAFIIKLKPNKSHRVDIGLALNADGQKNSDELYSGVAGYKTFQYAWYHGNFKKLGVSFLLLNTGLEYEDNNLKQKVSYMQTIGPRLTYKTGKFDANAAAYFQTGKITDVDVSTSYFGVNLGYKATKSIKVGIGMEQLSGRGQDETEAGFKSFAPLFGTNHKFNGWMDYFYVGNHGGSVGLTDINATISYKKDKFSAKLIPHLFSAPATVIANDGTKMDGSLGTEIDFTMGYALGKGMKVNAGYSHMLATETMERLKGGDKDATNSWAWVMFTFKPNLFSHKATTPPVK